jgi:Nuclear fragile X mental retardation-interacting protein 1 (NUFIP1)/Zinc finger C-x8-C-x5-C-x3-H type (and similar)
MVQFEYNGRTATLRTPAEIAAWIAERKRRYPTQAKADAAKKEAAEKKQKWAEVKKQREEAAKAKRLDREKQQEELSLKALEPKKRRNVDKEQKMAERDEAEEDESHAIKAKKARIKADKLRLRAEKAELKVLEAEAEARKARKRHASQQSSTPSREEAKAQEILNKDADSAITLEDNDYDRAGEAGDAEGETTGDIQQDIKKMAMNEAKSSSASKDEDDDEGQISNSPAHSPVSPLPLSDSSVLSDTESTSPPASSTPSSDASSDSDSDSDSAPEQTTSKRLEPTRVPPPPRRQPINTQHLCRSLLATGHCKRGAECSYSHDLPDTLPPLEERKEKLREKRKARLGKSHVARSAEAGSAKKERRKGLWQVMVEKEREEERKQVLKAIIFMGQKGMLGEDEHECKADGGKGAG